MLHIKKIKPLFTTVITTAEKFDKDQMEGGLITASKGDLKAWQTVLFVGDSVRGISPGDKVMIDFSNYMVRKYSKDSIQNDMDNNPVIRYDLNWVAIDGEDGEPMECLKLTDRDIEFAFEGEEKDERLIKDKEPKIIL